MGHELPLYFLLGLRPGQGSASTIYLLRVMSPSEEGPFGGPWGLEFCPIIFLSFMWYKARIDVP